MLAGVALRRKMLLIAAAVAALGGAALAVLPQAALVGLRGPMAARLVLAARPTALPPLHLAAAAAVAEPQAVRRGGPAVTLFLVVPLAVLAVELALLCIKMQVPVAVLI